jgi:hypothetical protein
MTESMTALTPGVRAYVSRETDLIAGALDQAAAAHMAFPPTEALHAVLERIHALQGLGADVTLSPLPELLAAMELATRSLLTGSPPPVGIGGILADAATALHAMAQSVAATGRVVLPPSIERVGRRLLEGYVAEEDVVPIADLAPAGWPSIVARGQFPEHASGSPPVRVELIAVGDHLVEQGRALAQADSSVAVELRLFVLHRTLTAMPTQGGTGRFLAPVARMLARAIAAPSAVDAPGRVATMLSDCGGFLSRAAAADDTAGLELARDAMLVHLAGGGDLPLPPPVTGDLLGTPIVPISALAPDGETDVVPIEALAPDADRAIVPIADLAPAPDAGLDIVPIAALAPDPADDLDIVPIAALAPDPADDLDIVPIAALAPDTLVPEDAPGEPSRLELAFRHRRALTDASADVPPMLSGLLGEPVVDVASLLYLGDGAFSRAETVRAELLAALADPAVSLAQLRPLLEELLDLLPLARRVA